MLYHHIVVDKDVVIFLLRCRFLKDQSSSNFIDQRGGEEEGNKSLFLRILGGVTHSTYLTLNPRDSNLGLLAICIIKKGRKKKLGKTIFPIIPSLFTKQRPGHLFSPLDDNRPV